MTDQDAAPDRIAVATYGKDDIRVLTWTDGADGVDLRDVTLGIEVEGDFSPSYLVGDNASILPSDTLRRHAVAECNRRPTAPAEELMEGIAARLLGANPAITAVGVTALTRSWRRHGDHSFTVEPWSGHAELRLDTGGARTLTAGLRGLDLLTTSGSGFAGFFRDGLTTQVDAHDRPLCGALRASWTYRPGVTDFVTASKIAAEVVTAFVDRPSDAIQQLLTAVTRDVLAGYPALATLGLEFEAFPMVAAPEELAEGPGHAHEIGRGPIGVSRVTLERLEEPGVIVDNS